MSMLNKATIVSQLAAESGLSKAATERLIAAYHQKIMDAVARDTKVKIAGFASFEPVTRRARTMRNPRTGEELEVSEAPSVRIRPLKRFKDTVSGEGLDEE